MEIIKPVNPKPACSALPILPLETTVKTLDHIPSPSAFWWTLVFLHVALQLKHYLFIFIFSGVLICQPHDHSIFLLMHFILKPPYIFASLQQGYELITIRPYLRSIISHHPWCVGREYPRLGQLAGKCGECGMFWWGSCLESYNVAASSFSLFTVFPKFTHWL